jgi:hypothetical protein
MLYFISLSPFRPFPGDQIQILQLSAQFIVFRYQFQILVHAA